jgi:hypothetical protein
MAGYPYDDDVLAYVKQLLFEALPALYRVRDAPPAGRGDLAALIEVLAAPAAVIRQNIEELHADLFIDTADDRIVPYLAEMVGTTLVFPDADSNRLDVRGTVAWRRRKGTPAALQEMAGELTNQAVVTQEGWKRVQLAQDLDLLRPERTAPDLRPAVVAEQATGPLDAMFHAVDVRAISVTTGRHHPRHVTHWLHPTVTFPLVGATAVERTLAGSDVRFVMDPLGERHALRARRARPSLEPFVDRIPEQHFSAHPEHWFAQPGGFTVRICGLEAAIAGDGGSERIPVARPADPLLGRGSVTLTILDLPTRGFRGGVLVELGLAPVVQVPPDRWRPSAAGFAVRASVELDAAGVVVASSTGDPTPGGARVPMLRLTPVGGGPGRFFPGATLEIASAVVGASVASTDSGLAVDGFLRGVLHVRIPPLQIRGAQLLHVAVDGSVYDAQAGMAMIDMPREGAKLGLAPGTLVAPGPGPAWPPLDPRAEPRMLDRLPSAPGCGPAVMHGARPVRRTAAGGFASVAAATRCALSFAMRTEVPGGASYRPFQRLSWTGSDPRTAVWSIIAVDGTPATSGVAEYAAVAGTRAADPEAVALAVRFECSQAGATLTPGEVAWTTDDGRTVLIHLPQLDAEAPPAVVRWPTPADSSVVSDPVRVAEDGSTWAGDSTARRRVALGAVAPIAEAAGLRRRRVRWRRLCGWDDEDWMSSPPAVVPPTESGRLDVDVAHGLFALSADEPPQSWTPDAAGDTPPSVTSDHEEGATAHLGARPAAREPVLDVRLHEPTRLVSRSGHLHADAPASWHEIPRYASLTEALADVDTRWAALTVADLIAAHTTEVIQFEDSSTYPHETPVWPSAPSDAAARARASLSLSIQAAERERPVILVDAWTPPAPGTEYVEIELRGIALGGDGWPGMVLPPCPAIALQLCTMLAASNALTFSDISSGADVSVALCETAGLELKGAGKLTVADSIVDAAGGVAIRASAGRVVLDRVSVGGGVGVRTMEASEVIFDDVVEVEDRFGGCVRYSRVPADSVLPRVHRVVVDVPVRVLSRNRRDAAWWRLRPDGPAEVSRGAESGSEMGAFSQTRIAERISGLRRRLVEYTPAGLVTGIVRID